MAEARVEPRADGTSEGFHPARGRTACTHRNQEHRTGAARPPIPLPKSEAAKERRNRGCAPGSTPGLVGRGRRTRGALSAPVDSGGSVGVPARSTTRWADGRHGPRHRPGGVPRRADRAVRSPLSR